MSCLTASEVVNKEGLTDAASWKTVRSETTYDGYGNATLQASLGVEGDELYTETEFVAPVNRWHLRLPFRERVYDAPGTADFAETLTYYDGDEDVVGLDLGQADEGFVTRVTRKVNVGGDIINVLRARRDTHGNAVETIDPNGDVEPGPRDRRPRRRAASRLRWPEPPERALG